MKKLWTLLLALALTLPSVQAQRVTDKLDRGLVAVSASGGWLVSWRIFAEEYYDVGYNLYRDGTKLNDTPIMVSNYLDAAGSAEARYQVAAVVDGVEQPLCEAVTPWTDVDGNKNTYYQFSVSAVIGRAGEDATAHYELNDISLGDVDGDGVSEFIVKRVSNNVYDLTNKSTYNLLECYNIKGKRLWYIDLGPNMLSGADKQYDIVFYDWDGDGKAEGLLRGADNMIIHTASGASINIGDMTVDTRYDGIEYTSTGNEYLLYLNGETGEPYPIGPAEHPDYMTYPLVRGLDKDWGEGIVGHRSTKHFFGAPVLDGRKASIFLARGIYTKHLMAAYDVDPATHKLTQRWSWTSVGLPASWHGQGYHNYGIADVDLDGRDEIVYGSMIIDDNGKGLSTTGLGHGDAQHCSDFDPYRYGLEFFACNESSPNMNYRNATTSEFYYRSQGSSDDGRGLMGNFSNSYPGSLGRSVNTGMISSVADREIPDCNASIDWADLNFRIYWDGDLLDEVLDSPGTEREAAVISPTTGRMFTSWGCKMNNSSKNNPGAQGDILGDWREEIVVRTSDNAAIRIYTTPHPTSHRIYTLWHDHQYRQAMVWQSLGYNQPPHKSYFLGELEGVTVAPPPFTMTGRVEIADNATIGAAHDGQHVLVCETNDTHITVAEGAAPAIVTFNVPSWTQGNNDNNAITTTYYTATVEGAAFSGDMRLVKQGEGHLELPAVEQTYSGSTDIWNGTLAFDGVLKNSPLWLNRFTKLDSRGGTFCSIRADYAAEVRPGGEKNFGLINIDSLALGFGSCLVLDIDGANQKADTLNIGRLSIETKDWQYGPAYNAPVFRFENVAADMAEGRYFLGTIAEIKNGALTDIKLEGLPSAKKSYLQLAEGELYLVVEGLRDASSIVWNGNAGNLWNMAGAENFTLADDPTILSVFVTGDKVRFDDTASQFDLTLVGEMIADTVVVDNTTAYTFGGTGSLSGTTSLVKRGTGELIISNDNTYTGGTRISGGIVTVSSLSNATQGYGALGGKNSSADKFIIENGATLRTTALVTQGSPMQILTSAGGVIENSADFIVDSPISGTTLTKKGNGWMKLNVGNTSLNVLDIAEGTVQVVTDNNLSPAKTVRLSGGTLNDVNGRNSYSDYSYNVEVPAGKWGVWNLDSRAEYKNKLTGAGTLTVNVQTGIQRTQLKGNWSAFEGVINTATNSGAYFPFDNSYGLPKAELHIAEGQTVVNTSGKTFAIGRVSGTGMLGGVVKYASGSPTGTCTWQIGNGDAWTFDGKITSTCNLAKIGAGCVTLTSANDYSGTTTVSAGELRIVEGATLGKGALTVAKGAILSGVTDATALQNSGYTINGTLQVGDADTPVGAIVFNNKNVTFSTTSKLVVSAQRCATASDAGCGMLQGIGKLTFNGVITVDATGHTLAVGDSIRLWKASSLTGTPTLESNVIDASAGLYWNVSRLTEGLLFVADDASGIEAITADTEVDVEVVTLGGTVVDTFRATPTEAKTRFAASSLPVGVYLLRMTGPNGTIVDKVVK